MEKRKAIPCIFIENVYKDIYEANAQFGKISLKGFSSKQLDRKKNKKNL